MNSFANYNKFKSLRELYIETNNVGTITFISSSCLEILGFTKDDMVNTSINKYFKLNFNSSTMATNNQVAILKSDYRKLFFDVLSKPIMNDNNEVIGNSFSFMDVSKYIEIQEKYTGLAETFEKTKDIVFKLQLMPELKFTYISPSIENIFGYDLDEFFNNALFAFDIVHPDDIKLQQSKVSKYSDFSKVFCVRFKHKDGSYVWIEDYIIPSFDKSSGELVSIHGISRDITERKILEQKLERLSYHDSLTGLYNRTYLNKQLLELTDNTDIPIGVIACDLDNLKYVNDSLGHSAGDSLIVSASTFFSNNFSKNCSVIRAGGDEFIIILPNVSLKESEIIYSEMLYSIKEYNKTNEVKIEFSSGFAYSPSSKNILELLNRADKNMYKNKYLKKVQGVNS